MFPTLLLMAAFVMAAVATAGVDLPRWKFGWAAVAFSILSVLVNHGLRF